MKIQFKQLIFSIMLLSVCGIVIPQETLRLTLKEAQDYALQNNKTIQNSGLAVSEAQKKVWEVISAGLPQVNATLDYTNMLGFKMELFGMEIPLHPTSNLQATVTQLLFNGSYWVGIKMARIGEQVAEISRQQSELDMVQQTQSAYLSVLIVEENKKILEKNLINIEAIAKSAGDMVRAGVAEQTDADRIKIQVGAVMNGIKSVERAGEMATNLLRFHLGVSMDTEIILTETLEDIMNRKSTQEVLETTFDIDSNLTMQLMDKQIEISNKQIHLEQASILPTVALFYNYTHKIATSSFDMQPKSVLGMQASIPIFASGQRYVKIQQAKIKLESAQNSRELVSEQILMQEKMLRFNLKNAVETLEYQKETLEISQRVFESITRKYNQGVSSSLDVITANTDLLSAQSNYISAMMQVLTAQTELEKLLNTL